MLIGEASIRLDAIADDLKRTIDRDINEALAGIKIDSDPLVKMTQDLRKAELDLVKAEDALQAAHRGTQETEAKLIDLRRSGTASANEVAAAERALIRARAEESVIADRVTVSSQRLAVAHGALTRSQKENESQHRSWFRTMLGTSSMFRRNGQDASGLGKVLDGVLGGALKAGQAQLSGLGSIGEGVFTTLTSKAVLLPSALAPLLGVIGGLIIALPALATVGVAALGAIALGIDGIKRAFKPLEDDLDRLKEKVSASFESALAPAVAKLPALFAAVQPGLQGMATALGGTVTQITNLITSSENLGKIRDLFQQTARFIQGMQPGINAFTQGFLNLASAVAPQLYQLGSALGTILTAVGDAFTRLQQLGLVKPAIDGLAQVFHAISFLIGPIVELFGRLAATLQGPLAVVITAIAKGLQAAMPGIQAFADGIGKAFVALAPALQAVLPLVGQVAGLIGSVLGTAIQTLAPPLTKLIEGLSAGLAPILPQIASAFADLGAALAPVLDQLAVALLDGLQQLLPIIPQLVGALVTMAPVFLEIVKAVIPLIPPLLQLVATILPPLIRLWLLIEKPMLETAGIILGTVIPVLVDFLGIVTNVVTGVVNFFTDFDTNVSKIWTNIVNFFKGIGDSIGEFFSGIGDKIVEWFQAGVDFLAGLPGKIGDWLSQLPGIVGNWLLEAGKAMLDAVVQGIEWVIAEFIALPFQIGAALVGLAQLLVDLAVNAWNGFVETAKTWGVTLITWAFELPGKIVQGLTSLGSTLLGLARDAWNGFVQSAQDAGRTFMTFVHSIPGRIRDGLSSLLGILRTAASNAWNGFINAMTSAAEGIWSFVRSLPGRVLGALGDIGGFLYNAGRNIIQGFINGIKAAAGAIGDVVGGILSKVRRLLPFSPAKEGPFSGRGWTLYSGMALMEGLADGLRAAGDLAVNQAAAVAAAVQGALSITPVIDTSALGANGSPTVPDLTGAPGQAAMAEAQLLALQQLVDTLASQGKTLPADLAAALQALRVVVSANEVASGVRSVDQQDARRR